VNTLPVLFVSTETKERTCQVLVLSPQEIFDLVLRTFHRRGHCPHCGDRVDLVDALHHMGCCTEKHYQAFKWNHGWNEPYSGVHPQARRQHVADDTHGPLEALIEGAIDRHQTLEAVIAMIHERIKNDSVFEQATTSQTVTTPFLLKIRQESTG
jgi:hypothetical protein